MSLPPVPKSAKRAELWGRLGIESDADHRLMLNEAQEGRDRLSYDPANLTPMSMADPRVKPPYKWDQLSETAKHREILNIFARASPRTRFFYEKARYTTPVSQSEWIEENWAIRWYIWHSFRYRDNRDQQAAGAARGTAQPGGGVDHISGQNAYFDAARAQWVYLY